MKKEFALKSKASTYEKKTVGVCSVVTGEKVAKLTLLDDKKKFKSTGTNSVKVKLSDLPAHPKLKPNNSKPIELRVRMNDTDTEVEAFGPVRGLHRAKLIDLGPKPDKDGDPTPFEKVFHAGEKDENRHLEFFAVYKITEGVFKGCEAAYYLHYKFEEDEEEEGLTSFSFNTENPKATRGQQLLDWGVIHGGGGAGIWGEPIPWDDDTILPELLERITDADIEVNLVFDKGYIQSIQPIDDMGLEAEESDESVDEEELDVDRDFPKDEDEKDIEEKPVKKLAKPVRKPRKVEEDDEDL